MLGQGISAFTIPVAIARGAQAWRARQRRPRAVAAVALAALAALVPLKHAATRVLQPPPPAAEPIACDCSTSAAEPRLEWRLGSAAPEGRAHPVRGSDRTETLDATPLATLRDVRELTPVKGEGGTVLLAVSLFPEAAGSLQGRAVRGATLAVVLDDEVILSSTVVGPIPADFVLESAVTAEEACRLRCAVEAR